MPFGAYPGRASLLVGTCVEIMSLAPIREPHCPLVEISNITKRDSPLLRFVTLSLQTDIPFERIVSSANMIRSLNFFKNAFLHCRRRTCVYDFSRSHLTRSREQANRSRWRTRPGDDNTSFFFLFNPHFANWGFCILGLLAFIRSL
jgi:hypothetical protein